MVEKSDLNPKNSGNKGPMDSELTRSDLLRTIEKKKRELELTQSELSGQKTVKKCYEQARKAPSKPNNLDRKIDKLRSVVRGKILYENAVAKLEKEKTFTEQLQREREEKEMKECTFSPKITSRTEKQHVSLWERTKRGMEIIEEKRAKNEEEKKKEEMKECTFNPSISRPSSEKYREKAKQSKERRLRKEEKSKGSVDKSQETKPKHPKRGSVSAKRGDSLSKRSANCPYCQKMHENFSSSENNKIRCFLGYYGLSSAYVHEKQAGNEALSCSLNESRDKYPRFDEYLSKSFIKQTESNSMLYRKIAETFQIFESFKAKMNDINDLSLGLSSMSSKPQPKKIQKPAQTLAKNTHFHKSPDRTYSNDTVIPYTEIKDLKFQRQKPFKMVRTSENRYVIDVLREDSSEIATKRRESREKYHKAELGKLDCPWNTVKKELIKDVPEAEKCQMSNLDRRFIKNYQRIKAEKELKEKYLDLIK